MTPVLSPASEEEIVSLFKNAAIDLENIVQRAKTGTTFYVYRLQQLHAIADVIASLDADSKVWVKENIPAAMEAASEDVKQEIKKQNELDFSFRFAGVPEEAVKVLTHQTYLDFGNTVAVLKRNGERAALNKLMIQRKIIQGTIQGSSTARTQQEILDAMKKDISTVQYRGGQKVPVEAYINMLVRTQTMNAYTVAGSQQMLAAGRMFAICPTVPAGHRAPNDPCWKWEKQRYINLLKDPLPPWHPNCRHSLQPISFAQLKAERPDLYEEAIAYFNRIAG
jgi:hypothetical protein